MLNGKNKQTKQKTPTTFPDISTLTISMISLQSEAYLNLNGPRKVADVDKERYVRAVAEVKVLVGEAVFELLDVAPGHDWDLLPGLGSCWTTEGGVVKEG